MRKYTVPSDLIQVKAVQPVVYKQYDNGDNLEVELFQDGDKINLTNEIVLAFFQLEDDTVIEKTCTINNGNAIATLDNNVLSQQGKLKVEFTIYDGEKETTTRTILITVEPSINRNEAIETIPEWDIVQEVLDFKPSLESLIQDADLAVQYATEAGEYAIAQGDYVLGKKPDIDKFTSEQNNLQKQLDVLVIGGDSSPEAAQARVNKSGTVYATLKARLDDENTKIAASLAEKAKQSDLNTANVTIANLNNRIDQIIVTPAQGITEQEIIDARQGQTSLGTNLSGMKSEITSMKSDITSKANKVETHNRISGTENSIKNLVDSTKSILREVLVSTSEPITYLSDKAKEEQINLKLSGNSVGYLVSTTGSIKTIGKNLFNRKSIRKDERIINDSGVEVIDTTSGYFDNRIPVKGNTSYYVNGKGKQRIYFFNGSTFLGRTVLNLNAETFTTPVNCNNIKIQYQISTVKSDELQIELGTTPTEYKPYTETVWYLPYFQLKSLPSGIKDTIESDKIIKKISDWITLNGSEAWTNRMGDVVDNGNHMIFSLTTSLLANMVLNTYIYSENFPYNSQNISISNAANAYTLGESVTNSRNNATLYITVAKSKLATQDLAGFKSWLAANPIKFRYQLNQVLIDILPFSLKSSPKGAVVYQNIRGEVGFYANNLTVSNSNVPIKAVVKLQKVDAKTGIKTNLDLSKVVITNGNLSFTHPDLQNGDLVDWDYEFDSSITTQPLIEYTYSNEKIFNANEVKITDNSGLYVADNVEEALSEVAQKVKTLSEGDMTIVTNAKTHSVVVAGSNSADEFKKSADYVATGVDDQNLINTIINSMSKGDIYFTPDSVFILSAQIDLKSNINLKSNGAKFTSINQVSSNLTQDVPIGSTVINVVNATGFVVGMMVLIQDSSGWNRAIVNSVDIAAKTVTLKAATTSVFSVSNGARMYSSHSAFFGVGISNVTFDGIEIDWNVANNPICPDTSDSQNGIRLKNSSDVRIQNCNIHHGGRHGIVFTEVVNSIVDKNYCDYWGEHGIDIYRREGTQTEPFTSNCVVSNNVCRFNGKYGIQMHRGSGVTIMGNVCTNNSYYGIGGGQESSHDNTIVGNICKNNLMAQIYVGFGSYNITIANNVILEGESDGIQIESDCKNIIITGNQIRKNKKYGIRLFNASNCIVSDNNCYNNCITEGEEIGLRGTSLYNLVKGNMIIRDGSAVPGIKENSVADNYNMIINNVLRGTLGISTSGANTVANQNFVY
jgi:parallel beta-helix repeat protein